MAILVPDSPLRTLRMDLIHIGYTADPIPHVPNPHVVITARRDQDDAMSIKSSVVFALRSGALRMAPAGDPNYLSAALAAAYAHRNPYKGTRSVLRGFAIGVPLHLVFAFKERPT